jgi:hypothetical protein
MKDHIAILYVQMSDSEERQYSLADDLALDAGTKT